MPKLMPNSLEKKRVIIPQTANASFPIEEKRMLHPRCLSLSFSLTHFLCRTLIGMLDFHLFRSFSNCDARLMVLTLIMELTAFAYVIEYVHVSDTRMNHSTLQFIFYLSMYRRTNGFDEQGSYCTENEFQFCFHPLSLGSDKNMLKRNIASDFMKMRV